MNWNDLRYFLAIHRSGSLGGAAKSMKVDQTTVSRRLTALEEALGVRLFDRTSDGLALTMAGERALERAGDLEERLGSMEAVVAGGDARPEGVVRIASSENLAVPFLVERLLRVRHTHPGLDIELVTSIASVNLLRREADIALRVAPRGQLQQQTLVARKLADIGITLYATRGYLDSHPPVVLADGLAGHEVTLFDGDIAESMPGRWIAATATAARASLKVNNFLCAASAAATGAVLALLPCFVTEMWPRLERAIPDNALSTDLWLLAHPEILRTARVRAVADHLLAQFEADKLVMSGKMSS